ncbi:NUDIX domain-containing protein [Paraburkholderia bannensis]|uniref:NUDIX domain-containing protein n=1 Tax=Paraburkholderia bannensis TaxID=765414 RepID=UPI0038BBF34F
MKERATVVCSRNGRILLMEPRRCRWSLPGGTIRRHESPVDAARCELVEEATLADVEPGYLFQLGGFNKCHQVICRSCRRRKASDEKRDRRCRWFRPRRIRTLMASFRLVQWLGCCMVNGRRPGSGLLAG